MWGRGSPADDSVLEREVELQALEAALADARAGSGALVVLEGHAGTGKTRLLELARQRARDAGMEVLFARGVEVERGFSFGVVLQLLERRVAAASSDERAELLAGAAALARPLLEGTAVRAGPEAVFPTQHGLYWLISNLADRAPLLLAVDDAHWADGASLRFLASLVHRLEGLPVALVVARRLGEAIADEATFDALAASPLSTVLRLHPLSEAAVAALVRARYDPSADEGFCRACAHAVGGNPLYLRELLVELGRRGIPATAEHAERVPQLDPAALSRSVAARLERTGRDATALAEAASVIEGGLPLRLVRRLARLEQDAGARAARELADAEVLTPDEPLRFVHPIVRRAVYARLGERRRAEMHRRAAELLHDERAEPERIGVHLQLGETRGEEWAARALLEAGQNAIDRGAPRAATAYLRQALSEGPPPELRPAILAPLGLAGVACGAREAVNAVRKAAELADSPPARARYLSLASDMLFYVRRYDEALDCMRRALAEVDDGMHEELAAELAARVAALNAMTVVSDQAIVERAWQFCDRLMARSGPLRTPAERLVPGALAELAGMGGELPAIRVRDIARRSLLNAEGEEIRAAMFGPTLALTLTDNYGEAEAALSRALDAASRRGLLQDFTIGSYQRADTRYRAGDLAGATADAETALAGARQGIDGMEPPTHAVLGLCLLDSGNPAAAERALTLADPRRWAGLAHAACFYEGRGRLALARNKALDAREAFREAGQVATLAGADNPAFCAWRSGAALAERALGDTNAAHTLAAQEVDRARDFGAPRALGMALRAQGLVVGGEPGLKLLNEAVEVLEPSAARLEHARALVDRGAALRRAGLRREAREDLRLALDRALECEALGLASRAREELQAAGGRPRRERLSGPAALTPQERRVAKMASEGLTNREIAEALFLTRRTVEAHLHSAYSKLGLASRKELPRTLSLAGIWVAELTEPLEALTPALMDVA